MTELVDPIQPGDVFVKQHGKREIIHLYLPRTRRRVKQPYMLLASGSIETTYNCQHWHLEKRKYRYIGTVPTWFLNELTNNTDW